MTARKLFKDTSLLTSAALCVSLTAALCALPTTASSEQYLGEMRFIAGNSLPRGWEFCDGQVLEIMQHTALFSLLGSTYGGDGRATFALPDARGRALTNSGTGPGLPTVRIGETSANSANLQGGTQANASLPWLAVRCIIAVQGPYPSRH